MDTSNLETFDWQQICRSYLSRLSPTYEYADLVSEQWEGLLNGLSSEEREGLARHAEVHTVYQRLAIKFATSSCWNCKNYGYCDESRGKRFSVEEHANVEPWKAFLCNSYEPDFNGLIMEITQLKEITSLLKGIGVPVEQEIAQQCLDQATRHWFDELKFTGHTVPSEMESYPG